MLAGSISTVMSTDINVSEKYASLLGKRVESGIYYRKTGDFLRSVLTPDPTKLLDAAKSISISSSFYLIINDLSKAEAELALLAEASGLDGIVVSDDPESFQKMFGTIRISKMLNDFKEFDLKQKDNGTAYIDRVFNVKGVGTVMLGFSGTEIFVHDKLIALPYNREIDVKSIQVLDEDQPSVGPGVRVGLAVRNSDLSELAGTYGLVKQGVPLIDELKVTKKFQWAPDAQELHILYYGMKAMGDLNGSTLKLRSKLPSVKGRALLINPNVKPGFLQVYGYAQSDVVY